MEVVEGVEMVETTAVLEVEDLEQAIVGPVEEMSWVLPLQLTSVTCTVSRRKKSFISSLLSSIHASMGFWILSIAWKNMRKIGGTNWTVFNGMWAFFKST
jgi:hypothetical protein